MRLDAGRHEVFVRGTPVALPLKEFELLELLMANAGRVLTRDVLIDRIWGPNYFGDTKTLDVHIKRLRSKVETDPANPSRIVTVRGVGYRYERATGRDRCSMARVRPPARQAGPDRGARCRCVRGRDRGARNGGSRTCSRIGALAVGVIDLVWTVPELVAPLRGARLTHRDSFIRTPSARRSNDTWCRYRRESRASSGSDDIQGPQDEPALPRRRSTNNVSDLPLGRGPAAPA